MDTADWEDIVVVATAEDFTIGLLSDGQVVSTPLPEGWSIDDFSDIVYIDAGSRNAVGVKADGTAKVAHTPSTMHDWEKSVLNWVDIVYLLSGYQHYDNVVMGLMRDGRALVSVNTEPTIRERVQENQGYLAVNPEAGMSRNGQVVIFYPVGSSGSHMTFERMTLRH